MSEIVDIKLLKEVLSDWDIFGVVGIEDNFLVINGNKPKTMSFTGMEAINIYELSYLFKKWAFEKGYMVDTRATCSELRSREYGSKVLDACHNVDWETGVPYNPICDIKVCEYILEIEENDK